MRTGIATLERIGLRAHNRRAQWKALRRDSRKRSPEKLQSIGLAGQAGALEIVLDRTAAPKQRGEAMLALVRPIHKADAILLANLTVSDDEQEAWLGSVLGLLKCKSTTKQLIEILRDAPAQHSKRIATFILARTRDKRAVRALQRTALDMENDEDVRASALDALSYYRPPRFRWRNG